MRLVSLDLTNFQSWKELHLDDLSMLNVFIGPNGVGKTNIVEALTLLSVLAKENKAQNYKGIAFNGDSSPLTISLGFAISNNERAVLIKQLFAKNTLVSAEQVNKTKFLTYIKYFVEFAPYGVALEELYTVNVDGGQMLLISNKGKGGWKEQNINLDKVCQEVTDIANLTQKPLIDSGSSSGPRWQVMYVSHSPVPSEYDILESVKKSILDMVYLDPVRKPRPSLEAEQDRVLDWSGTNLVKVLHTLVANDRLRYDTVTDEIKRILPDIQTILTPIEGKSVKLTATERGLSRPVDIENLSAGTNQILMLITAIVTASDDSIVIIEEPEIHLHASAQRHLFELIKIESERKQFFITTHSPIFTAVNKNMHTYLVTKQDGQSRHKLIQEKDQLRFVKYELGHKNTDLFSYDCIVFIEGDSEDKAFPIIAEAMGYDLVKLGIKLMNVRGAGKTKKIGQYLEYVKDSNTMSYVVADGDKTVSTKINDWVGANLIREKWYHMWKKEFEDCFDSNIIIQAMNKLADEQKFTFKLTEAELTKQRNTLKVAKVIYKYLHDNNEPSLDKPALCETIAELLSIEIISDKKVKSADKKRKPTEPEEVITNLAELVSKMAYV